MQSSSTELGTQLDKEGEVLLLRDSSGFQRRGNRQHKLKNDMKFNKLNFLTVLTKKNSNDGNNHDNN